MPSGPDGGFPLAILIYNIGDFVGKYSYRWIVVKDNWGLPVYVIIRGVVICAFYAMVGVHAFDGAVGKWYLNYIMLLILSGNFFSYLKLYSYKWSCYHGLFQFSPK